VPPLGHLVGDRAAAALGDLLRQAGDAQALRAEDFALVGLDLAPDQPQQGALALAVAAQEADPSSRSICKSTRSSSRGPPKARLTSRRLNNAMNALDLVQEPRGASLGRVDPGRAHPAGGTAHGNKPEDRRSR
jgi:hypothetical protein